MKATNPTTTERGNPQDGLAVPMAGAACLVAGRARSAGTSGLEEFLEAIRSTDNAVRGQAWQAAAEVGAPGVKPLVEIMSDPELEVARAAKRALWRIVRHAGRPGARDERRAVVRALVANLGQGGREVRRELIWMLSEVAGNPAVEPLAALLSDPELQEDARAALQRIPGARSLEALRKALETGSEARRPALAVSLRVRGEDVPGYPDEKLKPRKETSVKAMDPPISS